jgi:hypothetical protein
LTLEDWEDVIETGMLAQCRRPSNKLVDTQQEIETWVEALGHYDNNEFEDALRVFDNIAETSKILFNCGVIHATLGEHAKAVRLREWGV